MFQKKPPQEAAGHNSVPSNKPDYCGSRSFNWFEVTFNWFQSTFNWFQFTFNLHNLLWIDFKLLWIFFQLISVYCQFTFNRHPIEIQ